MKFLFPQFFWALFALAIPLLIHLINFRRYKTIHFSNTAFLQRVEKNTRSVNRLRQILIMLARMLALAALVFAFARPIIPVGEVSEMNRQTLVSIYIDNSYSMKVDGQNGPLLNEARNNAAELLQGLPNNARVQVLTNSFAAKNQRFYSKDVALELIDQIEPSPAFRNFEALKERMAESWSNVEHNDSARLEIFLLSDMQATAFGSLNQSEWPKNWNVNLVPLRPVNRVNNLAIDSLWFAAPVFQPGFQQELKVRIKNYGAEGVENVNLKLELNGQNNGMASLNIPAQNTATASLGFQVQNKGLFAGRVSIVQGLPAFDNEFFFSFSTRKPARVTAAGAGLASERLGRLFSDSLFSFSFQDFRNLNYAALPEQDLIIIETSAEPSSGLLESLRKALNQGHNLFLIPGSKGEHLPAYLRALGLNSDISERKDTLRTGEINYEDRYFSQVFASRPSKPDLPRVYRYFDLEKIPLTPLLQLENHKVLLGHSPYGNGDVFVSAVAFSNEFSNLHRHPILVPVLLNAALYQSNRQQPYLRAGATGNFQFIESTQRGESALSIRKSEGEIIPPQRYTSGGYQIFAPPGELPPGNYPIEGGDSTLAYFSLNIDSRESDLQYLQERDLLAGGKIDPQALFKASTAAGLGADLKKRFEGIELWKWFILAALIFLLVEIVLIKVWRS